MTRIGVSAGRVTGIASFCVSRYNNTRRQPRVTAACSYRERHASCRIAFITSSAHVISSEARNLPSSRVPMRFLITSFVEMTRISVLAGRVTGITFHCVSRYNNNAASTQSNRGLLLSRTACFIPNRIRHFERTCHFERSEKSSIQSCANEISPHFVRRNDTHRRFSRPSNGNCFLLRVSI